RPLTKRPPRCRPPPPPACPATENDAGNAHDRCPPQVDCPSLGHRAQAVKDEAGTRSNHFVRDWNRRRPICDRIEMSGDVLGPSANAEDFVAVQALRPVPDIAEAVALQLMYRAVRGFSGGLAGSILGNCSIGSRREM